MNQFNQFEEALALTHIENNIFLVKPDSRYFVGNTPHGGYLQALMHKALVTILPHATAISSSVQFLDRIENDDLTLTVDIYKIGRGSSSGVVRAIQDKKSMRCFYWHMFRF